jgi:prevent-host-death family protein
VETTTVAEKTYSVAEARQNLARLIRSAERGKAIEITRRGKPVAVLLSAAEYLALTGERPSFIEALHRLREHLEVEDLGISDEEFEGLRDESAGREVAL